MNPRTRTLILSIALVTSSPSLGLGQEDPSIDEAPPAGQKEQARCASGEVETEIGCIVPPRVLVKVKPNWPTLARRPKTDAKIVFDLLVKPNGHVGAITVKESSATNQRFVEAAIEALKRWQYEPATLAGSPIEAHAAVHVTFTREREGKK